MHDSEGMLRALQYECIMHDSEGMPRGPGFFTPEPWLKELNEPFMVYVWECQKFHTHQPPLDGHKMYKENPPLGQLGGFSTSLLYIITAPGSGPPKISPRRKVVEVPLNANGKALPKQSERT